MKATIWTDQVQLPRGFCYNCSEAGAEEVVVQSKGGIASSALAKGTMLGGVAGALRAGAASGAPHMATYCTRCAPQAQRGSFLDGIPVQFLKWYLRANQTAPGAAFELLNAGKDILRGNHAFLRIRYTNPRVLEEIRRLNPGIEIT